MTATSETWHPASILAASWLSQPFSGLGFSPLRFGIASLRNLKKNSFPSKNKEKKKEEKRRKDRIYCRLSIFRPTAASVLEASRVPGSPFLTSAPDHRPARMQSKTAVRSCFGRSITVAPSMHGCLQRYSVAAHRRDSSRQRPCDVA